MSGGRPPVVRRTVVVGTDDVRALLADPGWASAAFTARELETLGDPTERVESTAARLAAKRAVLSALADVGLDEPGPAAGGDGPTRGGPDRGEPAALAAVEVLRGDEGSPVVLLAPGSGGHTVLVSLSHDGGLAGALAVVVPPPRSAG